MEKISNFPPMCASRALTDFISAILTRCPRRLINIASHDRCSFYIADGSTGENAKEGTILVPRPFSSLQKYFSRLPPSFVAGISWTLNLPDVSMHEND